MNPNARNRLLIVAMMLFPIVVMILFWLYGNSPPESAPANLPPR